MTDAVKRAAGALHTHRTGRDNTICVDSDDSPASCWPLAHIALAAALDDREGMARVLARHQIVPEALMQCSCDRWPYDERDDLTRAGFAAHQVDALVAHLIGEGKA